MKEYQCRHQTLYNRKAHGESFVAGDLVWLFNPAPGKGQSRKLMNPWTGPYRVQSKLSDVNYRIQHTGNNKSSVVHFDRLKLCPKGIRLPSRSIPSRSVPKEAPQGQPSPAHRGLSLELVPDDDEEDAATDPDVEADNDEGPPPAPAEAARRYPVRDRRAPDWY